MLVNSQVPRDTKAMVAKVFVIVNNVTMLPSATPSWSSISSQVRAQYNAQPKIVRPIMEAIDGISKSFLAILARQLAQEKEEQEEEEEGEEEEMPSLQTKMEELVSVNQSLLEALDLSHPVLQQVHNSTTCLWIHPSATLHKPCQVLSALKSFGLTGKLTGAGGGGFAFALVPPGPKTASHLFLKSANIVNTSLVLTFADQDSRQRQ